MDPKVLEAMMRQRQAQGMAQPPPGAVPTMGPPPGAVPPGPAVQPPPTGVAQPEAAQPNPQGGSPMPGVTVGQGGQTLYNGTPVSAETLNYLQAHGGLGQ